MVATNILLFRRLISMLLRIPENKTTIQLNSTRTCMLCVFESNSITGLMAEVESIKITSTDRHIL